MPFEGASSVEGIHECPASAMYAALAHRVRTYLVGRCLGAAVIRDTSTSVMKRCGRRATPLRLGQCLTERQGIDQRFIGRPAADLGKGLLVVGQLCTVALKQERGGTVGAFQGFGR